MKLAKLLTCLPLLALTVIPPAADAKDRHGRNYRYDDYRYNDNSRYRYNNDNSYSYQRGHRPHDYNGDGVLERREWPGSNQSFRRLDRNRDGVLSESDRRLQRRDNRYYNWQRDRYYR